MKQPTVSEALQDQHAYMDMRDYQQLKVAHDMEVDATRRYFERLKHEVGETEARNRMRSQGYNLDVL